MRKAIFYALTSKVILLFAASAIVASCAHTTVRWGVSAPPTARVSGPIFVLVLPGPALPPDTEGFANLLLGIVHEHDPRAEIVHGNETAAPRLALDRGAGYLLVATVLHWRDAQTQYSGEPDRISIAVRVMQLRPSALIREFKYDAQGTRFAVRDAGADRLLDDKFRKAVRQLLASAHP